jgi:hypothetical protein
MNYLYRFLIFFDPRIRQLNSDNRALAKSLKVKFNRDNHPICERDRLFLIDFNQAQRFLAPPHYLSPPSRTPLTFNLKSLKIYPDIYLN